jgi:hypothetical protein
MWQLSDGSWVNVACDRRDEEFFCVQTVKEAGPKRPQTTTAANASRTRLTTIPWGLAGTGVRDGGTGHQQDQPESGHWHP